MSFFSRVSLILRAKSHSSLDALERPAELYNYAIEEQREQVRKVNRGLVDVATSRQRLERQATLLRERVIVLETQAKRALQAGREDLARTVLERKQATLTEIAALERSAASLEAEELHLATAARQLAARLDQFASRRTIALARYDAAAAQARAGETMAGVSGDMVDLTAAIHRAEERTDHLTARAAAITTLVTTGALDLPLSPDRVEAELQAIATTKAVNEELASLRASLAVSANSTDPSGHPNGGSHPE